MKGLGVRCFLLNIRRVHGSSNEEAGLEDSECDMDCAIL